MVQFNITMHWRCTASSILLHVYDFVNKYKQSNIWTETFVVSQVGGFTPLHMLFVRDMIYTQRVSSPGCAYQVVYKSRNVPRCRLLKSWSIFNCLHLASLHHCMLLRQSTYATNDVLLNWYRIILVCIAEKINFDTPVALYLHIVDSRRT